MDTALLHALVAGAQEERRFWQLQAVRVRRELRATRESPATFWWDRGNGQNCIMVMGSDSLEVSPCIDFGDCLDCGKCSPHEGWSMTDPTCPDCGGPLELTTRIADALKKARAARFEFGESG